MTDERMSLTKINLMNITNKITGRNITTEYLGLMMGIITHDEFELITMTPSKVTNDVSLGRNNHSICK